MNELNYNEVCEELEFCLDALKPGSGESVLVGRDPFSYFRVQAVRLRRFDSEISRLLRQAGEADGFGVAEHLISAALRVARTRREIVEGA